MQLAELDALLVKAARRVRILGALSYPQEAAQTFLDGWRNKRPKPPSRPEVKPVDSQWLDALQHVHDHADAGDPRGSFLRATAKSYLTAGAMLQAAGTPEFHARSTELYGSVTSYLPGTRITHVEAAERVLTSTAALTEATRDQELDFCLSAEHVADEIRRRLEPFFTEDKVTILIDDDLSAKAAASASRIRLRGRTSFSPKDIEQLTEHEAFVHSATALNGRKQASLKSLSLGAPRTTATQEGLATFAELITGAMELARLRRIALRVRAVNLAEDGADFVAVFRCFLDAGQSETESVHSAMRIFRGADPKGGSPFTKDIVYLRGLFAVHTFFRRAIVDVRPELITRLFAGRLTLSDVLDLDPVFDRGEIAAPLYVPEWAKDVRSLAAFLSFSAIIDPIDVDDLSLADVAG